MRKGLKKLVLAPALLCAMVMSAIGWAAPSASAEPVSILVFSAYSCPYCDQARQMLNSIEAKYPGRVRVILKHYPLGRDEKDFLAHEAAEAAAAQGKFRAMHDALYKAGTGKQDRAIIENIARDIGLNVSRFRNELDKHSWRARIEDDIAEAAALKVTATPTFFIDGYKLEGLQLQETLEQLLVSKRK